MSPRFTSASLSLILLAVLAVPAWESARGAAAPYGLLVVRAGAAWPEELTPVAGRRGDPVYSAADIEALRQRLEEQQLREGPYAPVLAETLTELALGLESMSAYEDALATWGQALHLTRVSNGLYSPAQGPLVRAILDNLRLQGDYAELDRRYDYFFRLYGAGQPPFTELRWRATMEYLRWQREALRMELDGEPYERLLELFRLGENLLEVLLSEQSPGSWQQLRDATFSQLKTFYLLEALVEDPPSILERSVNERSRRRDPTEFGDYRRQRLESLKPGMMSRVRSDLNALYARIPPDESVGRASVMLALGDWLQWQERGSEAQAVYERIWSELHAEGFAALARQWFEEPRPLPDNGAFWRWGLSAAGPVAFDIEVSESGRARVRDTEEGEQDDALTASRLRRELNRVRFRPRIVDGKVTAATLKADTYLYMRP